MRARVAHAVDRARRPGRRGLLRRHLGPGGPPSTRRSLAEWSGCSRSTSPERSSCSGTRLPALRASAAHPSSSSRAIRPSSPPRDGAVRRSKAALVQFARALSVDLAPRHPGEHGRPSIVDTPMSRGDLGPTRLRRAGFPVQTADEVAAHSSSCARPQPRGQRHHALSDFGFRARSDFPRLSHERTSHGIHSSATVSGTVVVITGGGTGIGAAIAERYAAEGAHVVVVGRRRRAAARGGSAPSARIPSSRMPPTRRPRGPPSPRCWPVRPHRRARRERRRTRLLARRRHR